MLTVPELKECLPKHLRTAATQEFADKINTIASEPETAEYIRDNFISYIKVLEEGKFKTEDYLNAVSYVSYKLMGRTNQDAYKAAFPDRYKALVARGATDKDISAYVSAYNKNKLVNLILHQSMVPSWVLNQDHFQRAINTQADLMINANSEKVRTDAANSLLTHLKPPETKQMKVDIGIRESEGMSELKTMLSAMATRQQELIGQGVTTREIVHQKLGSPLPALTHHTTAHQADVIETTAKDITPKEDNLSSIFQREPSSASVPDATTGSHEPEKVSKAKPLTSFRPES